MALIACPDCGNQVSDAAPTCPRCGRPIAVTATPPAAAPAPAAAPPKKKGTSWGCMALLVVGGLFLFLASFLSDVKQTDSPRQQAAAPAAAPRGVTMAQYNQLSDGMSYEQAVKILGSKGQEMSRNNLAGITTVMYMWEGRSAGANMNAMFQNGKLVQKAQFGLR